MYAFNTIQSSDLSDYVPSPTRDPNRLATFSGHPGIVIPFQQKVATDAVERSFAQIVTSGQPDDIVDAADLFAQTAMGTAYHTFAQHQSSERMYRNVRLPDMIDRETKERLSEEELLERTQRGLSSAAELAAVIEEMTFKGRSPELISKKNLVLGRSLATTAVGLAVVKHRVAYLRLDEADMQDAARIAAQDTYNASLDLTKRLGVRPTFAQFADDHSPQMQYLSTDPGSVSQPVYASLVGELARAEASALRVD